MKTPGTEMNCDEFKEAIGADPQATIDGVDAHVAACPSCAAWLEEMRALELLIGDALNIETPQLRMPALPPVEDDNVANLPFRRRGSKAPLWIGIAASAAIAAFIGLQFGGSPAGSDVPLADQILAHIDHEPGALRVTNVAVSDERLGRVVNPGVGTLDREVGLITYAQSCVINGKTIPHLVIRGEKGPVTLLLMPEEMVEGVTPINGESVNGVILPVGNGSIAIIGEREENLGEIEKRVIDSVEWSI